MTGQLAIVAAIEVVAVGVKYGVQILLARLGGPIVYGTYSYSLAWVATLALPAGLGLAGIVIRYVPQYISRDDSASLRALLRVARRWTFGASAVVAAIAGPVALLLLDDPALAFALVLLPAFCLVTLQSETLRGSRRIIASRVIPNLLQPLLIAAFSATVFFSTLQLTAIGAIGAMGAALVVTFVVQLVVLRRIIPESFTRGPVDFTDWRDWRQLSGHLLAVKIGQLILANSDVLAVGIYLGPATAGVYAAATKTAIMASVVTQAVNLAVPPDVARLFAEGKLAQIQFQVRKSSLFAFFPTAIACAALIVFAEQILGLFGDSFTSGVLALQLLAVGRLITSWSGPVGSLLNVTGHQRWSIGAYSGAAVLQLVLLIALLPPLGLVGAAVSWVVATICWNVVLTWIVYSKLQVAVWPLPRRAYD